MRNLLRVCLTNALLAAGLLAQEGEPPSPVPGERTVVRIRFEGNRRYTEEVLKEQIATKEGQPYDPGLLARDELVLREFFTAVLDIREIDVEDGVELVFVVLDKTVVGKVSFLGLARVREKDFEGLLSTRTGRPLLEHALESDRRLIERLHRQKGYHFVEVQAYRRPTRKPEVEDVVFQVITNRRVKVREVILEGAHSVDRKELLKRIKNSDLYRSQFLGLGRVFAPKYYNRNAVDEDRRRMEVYYQQEGWRDAKVVFAGVRFDEARKRATLKFRVDEGTRYTLAAPIEVEYAEGGEPEEADRAFLAPAALAGLSHLQPGDPFRIEDFTRTRRDISERLWSRAYARSTLREVVTDDAESHTVTVKLVLAAGRKYRLGRVRFFGNKWTRDNVLRRQFRKGALPGDYLDLEALQAAQNRLYSLRYFSMIRFGDGQTPWGLVRDPNAAEDVLDVEVEVEETDTRQLSFGAGVSTDGGAFAQFSITWRNFDIRKPPDKFWDLLAADAFRGGGQRFTLTASPGTTFSQFAIAFYDPAVRDSRWSLSFSIARGIALYDDYDQTTDGIEIRVGRYLDEDYIWNLSFSWFLRQVILDDPDPGAPVNALDVQGANTVHGVGVTLRRSRIREADAFLNGHVTTIGTEFLGGPLAGHVDVVKVSLEHRMGWRVLRTEGGGWHRLRIFAGGQWATAYDDTPEVPIFERFFLGGRSLRGFEFREVGPRNKDRPTGGEFVLTLSTQYTVPLAAPETAGFGLDLVFFLDQGGLTTEFSEFGGDDWRISAGFGLAIGFGGPTQPPLIIDFGWPLRSVSGDRRQVVSVAFERNF